MVPTSPPFSRREFLRTGLYGLGALSLADLYRLRAQGNPTGRQKSVIMIYLLGGPSHIDMYDLKPDSPVEFRGEFRPIRTNVPGIDVCELMPRHSRIADKFAVVRGLRCRSGHNIYEHLSGQQPRSTPEIGPSPRPVFGSVISKLRPQGDGLFPPYVSLGDLRLLRGYDEFETPAFLGSAHGPLRASGPALENLALVKDVTPTRLDERRFLLHSFDQLSREVDVRANVSEMDRYTARAMNLLTSPAVREAFDISREPARTRERYGGYDDFLRARRLVEAGVSVVTLPARFPVRIPEGPDPGGWDTHAHNFQYLRAKLPRYDLAMSALISDLSERGLLEDVAVVAWGEFGRKPRIGDVTADGRGHWPDAAFAFLAGGGLKTGQIVGETDSRGERAKGRPYTPAHVLATLYTLLGVDLSQTTFVDHSGRPQYILDQREPIDALLA